MSQIKRLFKIDRKTLKEALLGEYDEYGDDPNRMTTIAVRVETKRKLSKWIPKGCTYDEGLRRILDLLEKWADKPVE